MLIKIKSETANTNIIKCSPQAVDKPYREIDKIAKKNDMRKCNEVKIVMHNVKVGNVIEEAIS